jgi:digeranylgeranylglycerophospholipid reductase
MYDVIIAGCGPAGGTLAAKLDGLDVLVLEKERNAPLKDSGIVSKRFFDFFDDSLIETHIDKMEAVSPSGKTFFLRSEEPFGAILKRKRFSYHLRIKARETAEIKYERVRDFSNTDNGVTVETSNGTHEAKMIVGCDGTLSDVRTAMGIKKPEMVPGIFVRTKKMLPQENIKVFFNKFYSPDFFSWVIPQINEYGIMTNTRPRENFDYFKKSLSLPEGELHSYMIPMGITRSYADNALLIGESCGQTKPLTGGGIMFSMRAASIASDVIKDAVKKQDFSASFLSDYDKRWRKEFYSEIRNQLLFRRFYRRFSNNDLDKLFDSFGPDIENINEFDYDHISESWRSFPKRKAFSFLLRNLGMVV